MSQGGAETLAPPRPGWGSRIAWVLLVLVGGYFVIAGFLLLGQAVGVPWMSYEGAQYIRQFPEEISEYNRSLEAYIVMVGGIAPGGVLVGYGLLTAALAYIPFRRGEAWAWWALLIANLFAFTGLLVVLGVIGYRLTSPILLATLIAFFLFVAGVFLPAAEELEDEEPLFQD